MMTRRNTEDLRVGRIDAILVDRPGSAGSGEENQQYPRLSRVMRSPVRESGVAVRKGNEDLLKAIDGAIAEMQKDGSLKALSEKWFGADVTK